MSSNLPYALNDINIMVNKIDNSFFNILTTGWNIYEILLNILFIILVLIISVIIYWDTINKKVENNSRCRKQKDLFDKLNGIFTINVKDKSGDNLFNIDYDFNNKSESIKCSCKSGEYSNSFTNIPIRLLRTNENDVTNKELPCKCDKFYEYNKKDSIYEGEPGLIRYMINHNNDNFFKEVNYAMNK
tara:strand:- start:3646 stop:4206 length:561 start_codon:yes stop_codon:yes gene_type:complete